MKNKYDFGGWATKYNIACSDGRTISNGAFKHCDGAVIPMVWNHSYTGPESIIGNVTLKHMDEGVYAYGSFNDTDTANTARSLVAHGDITSLSIYANKLQQKGCYVLHGDIKEVSLVLAGANPGASIQEVLVHGDVDETQATIYNDPDGLELFHGDTDQNDEESDNVEVNELEHADTEGETVADVYATLTEKQKKAVAIIIDQLAEGEEDNKDNEGDPDMKHNVFDNNQENELKHFDVTAAIKDAKKLGSLKEAVLTHAATYGIQDIESLFPEAHKLTNEPQFIDRDQSWVKPFFNATKKSPFSRIKTVFADITADEARARGYIKGNLKKEEVFSLLKRTTSPTTVYKKQKLDRDDIIDITDFDVVAWMKREMRGKLEEELARAILVGDGRNAMDESKIKESCIRPIYNDHDLYTLKVAIGSGSNEAKEFIKSVIKAKVDFEGTGMPNLYTTGEMVASLRLIEDANGRFIYPNNQSLCDVLGVKEIIEVPVMKNLTRTNGTGQTFDVKGILVNPADYTVGADKGGEVSMFDDFDIDYNQYKYLIETRCSGSLTIPKSAAVIEKQRG